MANPRTSQARLQYSEGVLLNAGAMMANPRTSQARFTVQ